MTIAVSPTQSDLETALRSYLLAILAAPIEVVLGQDNRVPEPKVADFVVMTPMRRPRLATNVESDNDVLATGSIALASMTITAVQRGALRVGALVFGVGVAASTTILSQTSGTPGGVGVYAVSQSQSVASTALSAGSRDVEQDTQVLVQLDVHGPRSADNAQIVSTLFRGNHAAEWFSDNADGIAPLFCEDPKQIPYTNDQQQVEDRWVVEVFLQANETVSGISQEYAGAIAVQVVSVEATYPPS